MEGYPVLTVVSRLDAPSTTVEELHNRVARMYTIEMTLTARGEPISVGEVRISGLCPTRMGVYLLKVVGNPKALHKGILASVEIISKRLLRGLFFDYL